MTGAPPPVGRPLWAVEAQRQHGGAAAAEPDSQLPTACSGNPHELSPVSRHIALHLACRAAVTCWANI
ncbi:hypothetical protein E2C01_082942 [Portunus trituberculatus]|uniref:Uncharacterized protein n=1 Tax=Portunus trituberculatus TaxID=210409 RepID=A0A5B7J0M1_PORTR|nr:hypothetical protein [Portunus trituberculatus]